jgi:hypothetical protein
MQDSLGQEIEANKMYPFFAYHVPTSGNSWDNISYGVVPMNVTNVRTVHYVTE